MVGALAAGKYKGDSMTVVSSYIKSFLIIIWIMLLFGIGDGVPHHRL